ncbi:endonuclease/exonuclease/phosphatase family protein [Nocardioides aquiterrae]|uniref:Endonuclease/exonuclease/phosphatase domain-containing protein n=1 Tax=Nocardioides aquiterrae TaxID=203799 RepID=A0ABN1UCL5_9ACTN
MLSDARSRQRLAVVAALLLGMVLGAGALRLSGMGGSGGAAQLAGEDSLPTQFTISSLNALGADHTAPGGNKHGWAPGAQRMKWLTQVIKAEGVEVIGLQEFQYPQYQVWEQEMGTTWDSYPALAWGKKGMRNSVAWRSDQFSLVTGSWMKIPYFHGTILRMPLVLLQNLATGQQLYVASVHNPANARGPAAKWRKQATEVEMATVNRLRADTGLPVYLTGDMNERDIYYCRMTAGTDMVAANGGVNTGNGGLGGCAPTRPTFIDWIFGSPETTFTNYHANRGPKVRRSTDHPMIVAEAELPPVATPPCPTESPTPTTTGTPTPTPTTSSPRPTGSPTPNVPSPSP